MVMVMVGWTPTGHGCPASSLTDQDRAMDRYRGQIYPTPIDLVLLYYYPGHC